jgi:hypothetical protein
MLRQLKRRGQARTVVRCEVGPAQRQDLRLDERDLRAGTRHGPRSSAVWG